MRLTNLYWHQQFGDRVVGYLGFMDVTDYVEVYALVPCSCSSLAWRTIS